MLCKIYFIPLNRNLFHSYGLIVCVRVRAYVCVCVRSCVCVWFVKRVAKLQAQLSLLYEINCLKMCKQMEIRVTDSSLKTLTPINASLIIPPHVPHWSEREREMELWLGIIASLQPSISISTELEFIKLSVNGKYHI